MCRIRFVNVIDINFMSNTPVYRSIVKQAFFLFKLEKEYIYLIGYSQNCTCKHPLHVIKNISDPYCSRKQGLGPLELVPRVH